MMLERARMTDAPEIATLRTAANAALTDRHGKGFWSGIVTERWVKFRMRHEQVYAMRHRGRIIGTFMLANKKPWAIDRSYFTPIGKPLYLQELAVLPAWQGRGVGRQCLEAAFRMCREWPADAIYLDAFDAKAGAGGFYVACGFRKVGRVSYRGVPLMYFERLVKR